MKQGAHKSEQREEDNTRKKSTIESVPICSNSTFCMHATHYPEKLVNRAIQGNDSLRLFQAETIDRRWLYVVNQKDNLQQGVRIEMCAKEGSVCGDLDDYLPGGYKAFCKQKYVYRELVAVDGGIVKKDSFRFPSSCCCHREFVR